MNRYLLIVLLLCSTVCADEPAALYIFPAGGQRGQTVDVRVGGMALHERCAWSMVGPGVTASPEVTLTEKIWFEGPVIPLPDSQRQENYPRDYAAQVQIAADAPLGTRWWRVANSQGVSPALRFVVGDLPEIVEHEIDGEAIPVDVTLPLTINGRMFPREDIDLWVFEAKRGETIRCEVTAARLGSLLDSQLEILDASGRRLASNGDHYGVDSLIVFTAPADGRYTVRIHDAAFGGLQTYVYRLTLSALPHVTNIYPLGGKRGATTAFELGGVNLPKEAVSVAIPASATGDYLHTFAIAGKNTNAVALETSDVDELLEREPNTIAAQALKLAAACVANGRIDEPGDVDSWTLEAKKGETFTLDMRAGKLGSPLDSVLIVEDATGKEVARSDDISGTDSDSQLRFAPSADGTYTVKVSERYASRGGREFAYRLHVAAAGEPDFRLTMAIDAVTLYRDGQAKLRVQAQRLNGFNEQIAIVIDNLPPGVTVGNDKINKNAPQTDLTFKAPADAKIELRQCVVRGVAKVGDQEISRRAVVPVERGELPLDTLQLAMSLPTPFKIVAEFQLPYAPRGTVYLRPYNLERNGFDGPLEIMLADKQGRHLQGVTGPTMQVPASATSFVYPLTLPPWLELGRTSRTLVTAIGWVDDGSGRKHQVSFTSTHQNEQVSLIASPCPLGIELPEPTVVPRADQPVELPVVLDRDAGAAGPVRVELVLPRHIRGVAAEPIVISAGANEGRLTLRFAADAGPFNMPLTVRGTLGEGNARMVNEAKLEVVK
ncbi:MAG: PPC domain-containing protein [Planctomycetaceae bacterium]|nr:PPC domain-containing protein [Planctomycetaceae bacterium]